MNTELRGIVTTVLTRVFAFVCVCIETSEWAARQGKPAPITPCADRGVRRTSCPRPVTARGPLPAPAAGLVPATPYDTASVGNSDDLCVLHMHVCAHVCICTCIWASSMYLPPFYLPINWKCKWLLFWTIDYNFSRIIHLQQCQNTVSFRPLFDMP